MIDQNNLVEKSKPLIWAKFNNYTVNELKILEIYLSRINARDSKSCEVKFTKQEYCEFMGLSPDTTAQQLKKYVQHFLGNVVTIDTEKGWRQFTLFTEASCEVDDEIGQNVISISCNPKLENIFFNIAEDGYIRYKLKNIINLKSQYSVRLYSILKDKNYGNHEWTVSLGDLKELLQITAKRYESFKFLNAEILKKCEKEINEYTDICFTYEKITKGRLTRAIKFKIKNQKIVDDKQVDGQMDIYDFPEYCPNQAAEESKNEVLDGKFDLWSEACRNEFNRAQLEELALLAEAHVEYDPADPERHDLDLYRYLQLKYKALQNKQGIKSRFGYMKYLVENDI